MIRWRKWFGRNPVVVLGLGVVIGLLVGVLKFPGTPTASSSQSQLPLDFPLHANGAHGHDGFAVATGNIDGNVDGLYTLDFLSGNLACWVINPKTGTFLGLFTTNVNSDLGIQKGKKANFAMATGLVGWAGGKVGPLQPGNAVVYVADCNTGNFAAYGLFCNTEAMNNAVPQRDVLRKIAVGKGRDIPERDK